MKSLQLLFQLVNGFLIQRVEHDLEISNMRQPSTRTCWATCYQMVDSWNKQPRSICHYVRLQTGDCGNCKIPEGSCNRNRPTEMVLSDWRALGYKGTRRYCKPLTLTAIRNAHKKRRPIHIFFVPPGRKIDNGHFALVSGTSRIWNADTALLISDPANPKRKAVELEYSNFVSTVTWSESWVVAK